ncbi:MAG: hypothetical protein CMF89_00735 [Candidatus Marinimicrobia bacterium]|nr:hypothetical protein [Candidatus Neomarinimicrobiota bacterium]
MELKTLIRLGGFFKPYKFILLISIIASVLYGLFNAASLWIVGTLIANLFGSSTFDNYDIDSLIGKINYFFSNLISSGSQIEQLKMICIFLFITFLFKNIFYYINWVSVSYIQLNIIKNLRNKFYSKIQQFSLQFFDKNKTGEILSIMLNDINWIKVAFNKSLQVFINELISILILVYMLFLISPILTLLILCTVPISAFLILKISQSIKRKVKRASLKIADISSYAEEKIIGIKIVKAFNMAKNEISNFFNENHKFFQLEFRHQRLYGLTTPINDIIGVTLGVFLLWYGGQEVLIYNKMSSDDFMRFIIFLFAMLQPARKLGNSIATIQTGLASAERLFEMTDQPFTKLNEENLGRINGFKKKIQIKNLNFSYSKNSKNILSNINLTIKKGEKVALVGSSGSGKTTLTSLLLRFYNYNNGDITIDDKSYNEINTKSVRNLIGLVTQEPILFNDTIKNNITYGSENIKDKQIEEAAQIAKIDDFISSLDLKYETIIGERGSLLSGGQKQRLSIARAIIKNPPILVFDEATSSLDSQSEKKVQEAIDNLVKDRTVIMIAHRLTTVKNVDKIVVLEEGSIKEIGSHEELLNKNGYYSKLYNIQFRENNE